MTKIGFPVCAGIDLRRVVYADLGERLPRVCGDRPKGRPAQLEIQAASPCVRG